MRSTLTIIELLPSLPYPDQVSITAQIYSLAWKHSDWKGRARLLLTSPSFYKVSLIALAFVLAVTNSLP